MVVLVLPEQLDMMVVQVQQVLRVPLDMMVQQVLPEQQVM